MGIFGNRRRGRRRRLTGATLVMREWFPDRGLVEREAALANLTELLEMCLESGRSVPERITLIGTDEDGRSHSISFSFAATASRRS